MSRDDYISKLFINNQDKLNQKPSEDFWSKLEQQLDVQAPDVQTQPAKVFNLYKYLAAASVIVAVFSTVLVVKNNNDASFSENTVEFVLEEPIALLSVDAQPYEDVVLIRSEDHKDVNEKEVIFQADYIEEEVNKKIVENNVNNNKPTSRVKIDDIAFADKTNEISGSSVILIETEDFEEEELLTQTSQNTFYQDDMPVQEQNMNYANAVPQISNSLNNNDYADEVLNIQGSGSTQDQGINKGKRRSQANNRGIVNKTTAKKSKSKSPISTANQRLRQFEFLLGETVDEYEKEGRSFEKWSVKNHNTLSGKGYKLSSGNEIIFEETMKIELRNNQIFFVISFNESGKTIQYMLSEFDIEHYVFVQSSNDDYPDKIVIQRTLDGFSTVISNSKKFIPSDQQRFLENRNRVTNKGARRTMNYR
jgi:hypothetical protein